MATLTIAVGSLTASYTATNASAAKVLTNYTAAYDLDPDGTATQQEKLQAVVNHLAQHISEVSRGYQRRSAREVAEGEADAMPEKLEPEGGAA